MSSLAQHRELCSMLCGSLAGRGVRGRMDTCIGMAESLFQSPTTITTVLTGYTPTQNKKFNKKKVTQRIACLCETQQRMRNVKKKKKKEDYVLFSPLEHKNKGPAIAPCQSSPAGVRSNQGPYLVHTGLCVQEKQLHGGFILQERYALNVKPGKQHRS